MFRIFEIAGYQRLLLLLCAVHAKSANWAYSQALSNWDQLRSKICVSLRHFAKTAIASHRHHSKKIVKENPGPVSRGCVSD